jgi:hypothetical protein
MLAPQPHAIQSIGPIEIVAPPGRERRLEDLMEPHQVERSGDVVERASG